METNTYWLGSMKIESSNIDEAKELCLHLRELEKENGMELSKHLNDFCFDIDVRYQQHYNLDRDDWSVVDKTLTRPNTIQLDPTQFLCDGCNKVHTMSKYAIAQTAMNVELIFKCDCGEKNYL